MDDDVDQAKAALEEGESIFHRLGLGVIVFLRATLGFEQDVMREASDILAEVESVAFEQQKRSSRTPNSYQSLIYSTGTEYALCHAESQLMGAVVCVLNESLSESIKGFYKLRKAYHTLTSILESEKTFLRGKNREDWAASVDEVEDELDSSICDMDDNDEFFDAAESGQTVNTAYIGHLSNGDETNFPQESPAKSARKDEYSLDGIPDVFGDNPIDTFILSGSNLCFGLLLLLISMIPPAFNMLLKIVGFRGDKERGLRMLWQATRFDDIHGAISGLVLFAYYNGIFGFCDIIPDQGEGSFPRRRCGLLLEEMRRRYPKSHLWLLEDARLQANERNLERAVEIMDKSGKSPLKQLEALQWFERSLNLMYLHDYLPCSASFQRCVTMNNWSHGLYYYIAGSAHVEMYRKLKGTDPMEANENKQEALRLLQLVEQNSGKKRFMARELPFDTFIHRKVRKWKERAEKWGVDLVDAVGVSPIEEIIYFWNGYKKMKQKHLEIGLERLAWSTSEANPRWSEEDIDEKSILALLRATILRNLKRYTEAKQLLQTEILSNEWVKYKGSSKDSWVYPCSLYEMAALVWKEQEGSLDNTTALQNCYQWLDDVARWESFDLDARIGLKVTAGKETLRRYGIGN